MSVNAEILRRQAELVSAEQLSRSRRRIGRLTPGQQRVVRDLAGAVGRSIAELLAEEARRDPHLAAALAAEGDV